MNGFFDLHEAMETLVMNWTLVNVFTIVQRCFNNWLEMQLQIHS